MDYQRLYDELIEKARSENRTKVKNGTYYEAHHIVPKCLGGEGKCSEWKTHPNIVLLTAEEHFYAHYYLIKTHPENSKLLFAFGAMCNMNSNGRRVDRNYSEILNFAKMWKEAKIKRSEVGCSNEIRAKMSAAQKGKKRPPHTEERKARIAASLKGRKRPPLTDERKAKLSAAKKGKKLSDETRAKMRGRTLSQEAIAKRTATRKGKPSPKKGVPLSEERKAAMRETWKLRKEGKLLNKS